MTKLEVLESIRRDHKQWELANFGAQSPRWSALGAVEESGELAHFMLKFMQGIRGVDIEKYVAEGRDALADIAIYAISVANKLDNFYFSDMIEEEHLLCTALDVNRTLTREQHLNRLEITASKHADLVTAVDRLYRLTISQADVSDNLAECVVLVIASLNGLSDALFDVSIVDLTKGVWDATVSKRQWKAAPVAA